VLVTGGVVQHLRHRPVAARGWGVELVVGDRGGDACQLVERGGEYREAHVISFGTEWFVPF
jgi:hypothetical protein